MSFLLDSESIVWIKQQSANLGWDYVSLVTTRKEASDTKKISLYRFYDVFGSSRWVEVFWGTDLNILLSSL